MKKVAICLSGEARALEVTKRFYDTFASIDGYEVSIFIATWQSNYTDALSSIKNLKSIEVGTQISNSSSINMYTKLGFSISSSFYVLHMHKKK